MGGCGALLDSAGSRSVLSGKNCGICCEFCVMKMIYHGRAQEILMKLYIAMSKLEAMKGRNGTRRALEKQCSIAE
jgi:hypothetical protein